jgi:hypothetical protein
MSFNPNPSITTPNPYRSRSPDYSHMSGPSGSRTPSKPPTPRLYSYGTHSRSKTHLPHPITLPFPDLPIRGISREGSRSASPAPTPVQGSTLNLHAIPMTAGGLSSDGGLSSPTETPSRSLSPPSISRVGPSASTPHLGVAGPSRLRSQTTSVTREISTPLSSPLPVSRTQGFNPSTIPHPHTTSPPTSPDLRPTSLPIQPIIQSRPASIKEKESKPPPPIKKLTNPPVIPPDTVQITPSANTSVLGDHVYLMFLQGRCADVRIWVAKWKKAWRIHKMVLVQAGEPTIYGIFQSRGLIHCRRVLSLSLPRWILGDEPEFAERKGQSDRK